MSDTGDAVGVLRWGLRKYAWVVALCVVVLGVVTPKLLTDAPKDYEAQAQVGPTEQLNLPNLDPLPRLGESIFNNGVVADAVRHLTYPPTPPTVSVIPEQVELIAAQDNIIFSVVGHGQTASEAERIANVAAARFVGELNKYASSVSHFTVQQRATPPVKPVSNLSFPLAVAIGVLAGLLVGIGLVALLLVWRRPVIDADSAGHVTGAPVLARLRFGRSAGAARGLPRLCRRILSGGNGMLLLSGPRNTHSERQLLAADLAEVFARTGRVISDADDLLPTRVAESQELTRDTADPADIVILREPSAVDVAARPSTALTLLVVREGVSSSSLRKFADEYLDEGDAGVVLVASPRWRHRRKHREREDPPARPISTPSLPREALRSRR